MPGNEFVEQFRDLLEMRRDVRHFLPEPVGDETVRRLLEMAMWAPSVGYSQPWRWVVVRPGATRAAIFENHVRANAVAAGAYEGDQGELYRSLKLSGIGEAPVQIAVFVDGDPERGSGLGRQTMPETVTWSVVMAIHTLWLAATAEGLGLGWVSIVDPEGMGKLLEVPREWRFLAYLCLGRPVEGSAKPLLERAGWERRAEFSEVVLERGG